MFPELTTGWLGMWGLQRLSKEKRSSKIMALHFCVQHAHSLHFWMRLFLTSEIPFLSRNVWSSHQCTSALSSFVDTLNFFCVTQEERVKNMVPSAAWHKVDFFFSLPKRTNDGSFLLPCCSRSQSSGSLLAPALWHSRHPAKYSGSQYFPGWRQRMKAA